VKHDLEKLIPFYVNGTLDDDETNRVKRALAHDPELACEVDKEMALVRLLGQDPMAMEALNDQEEASLNHVLDRVERGAAPVDRRPWMLAAATVLVVVASASFWLGQATEPSFETLSTPAQPQTIQVIFHETATERDLRLILMESGATLVGNPSAKGVYRMTLPGGVDATAYVQRLRDHPAVRWSEAEL